MTIDVDRRVHIYVYLRNLTVKFVEHYQRNADGVMTMTLTADGFDLPVDIAELEALHVLLGEMLRCADDSCPCYAAGEQAARDRRP